MKLSKLISEGGCNRDRMLEKLENLAIKRVIIQIFGNFNVRQKIFVLLLLVKIKV